MYDRNARIRALELLGTGITLSEASRRLGISRAALREWRSDPARALDPETTRPTDCPRCTSPPEPFDREAYAYLLGQYLGDGCLSVSKKGVYALRIAMDDKYPGMQHEVAEAIRAVRPPATVGRVQSEGCSHITSWWKHWPCLFPQHCPGRKHERPIILEDWQREIVEQYPGRFLRGLFHSDGYRGPNPIYRMVGGEKKRYEYMRYFFTNASDDIRALCTWALDLLRIPWRRTNARNIAVSRREAVAELDKFVGPKF